MWGPTKRPTSDHARAVRTMVGNLICDCGLGQFVFKWDKSSYVVAYITRNFLSPSGVGFVGVCPELIENYTLEELREIMLRLVDEIKAGKPDSQECCEKTKVPASQAADDGQEPMAVDESKTLMGA